MQCTINKQKISRDLCDPGAARITEYPHAHVILNLHTGWQEPSIDIGVHFGRLVFSLVFLSFQNWHSICSTYCVQRRTWIYLGVPISSVYFSIFIDRLIGWLTALKSVDQQVQQPGSCEQSNAEPKFKWLWTPEIENYGVPKSEYCTQTPTETNHYR